MITFKQQVHFHFQQVLSAKIEAVHKVLADLKESGANETKSTAGDKHETALAMLQIEQANKRGQLDHLLQLKAFLNKINPALSASVVSIGSLVNTNRGLLYLSVALGKEMIDDQLVIALSPESPLGSKLMQLSAGSEISVNGNAYRVLSIS